VRKLKRLSASLVVMVSSLLRQLVESSIDASIFSAPREAELKGLAGTHVMYAIR
jgi:hypothetical protein